MEEETESIEMRPANARRTFTLRNNVARHIVNFMPSRQMPHSKSTNLFLKYDSLKYFIFTVSTSTFIIAIILKRGCLIMCLLYGIIIGTS